MPPALRNRVHSPILVFYAESDSVNNSYQWRSPLRGCVFSFREKMIMIYDNTIILYSSIIIIRAIFQFISLTYYLQFLKTRTSSTPSPKKYFLWFVPICCSMVNLRPPGSPPIFSLISCIYIYLYNCNVKTLYWPTFNQLNYIRHYLSIRTYLFVSVSAGRA